MVMPRRFRVTVHEYRGELDDGYGTLIDRWEEVGREELVYGVNFPSKNDEPREAGHNRLVVDYKLLVPPEFHCSERDRVSMDGYDGTYEVVGVVAMADRNPFNWNPGGHVNLRRVDG